MPSPIVTFSVLAGLRSDSVDTTNAIIRGVSVLTSGLVARGHGLAVDATTLEQMLAAAESKKTVPVKVNHGGGAEAVCGYLTNFQIAGKKLKADWHLLKTHPQRAQILEVATVMPAGVGLSASFLPPEKCEAGKARCEELLSVDYVTLPAANPDGLFAARVEDRAARRKAAVARATKIAGAGALGAVGAASIAARGVDRAAALGLKRITPRVRAGLIGAAAGVGALQTVRAVAQGRKRPAYADPREMAADFTAALVSFGMSRAEAAREAAALVRAEHAHAEKTAPRATPIQPRRPLGKRIAIRAAKVGVGTAGGAYIGRKLGTAAGAATGAAAGLLFQSKAARNSVRAGLTFAARLNRSHA